LIGSNGRRKPDVRATYLDIDIAIEVQLSTTLLPTILNRRQFYESENRHLLWTTWNFSEPPFEELKIAFSNIYFEHSQCIFSMDCETIAVSIDQSQFLLRAHWFREGHWSNKIFKVSELKWDSHSLPTLFPPRTTQLETWRQSWLLTHEGFKRREKIVAICRKLGTDFEVYDATVCNLEETINCMLAIIFGKPIHSAQKQLIEQINTYLHSDSHFGFADSIKTALRFSDHGSLLARPSVVKKLSIAMSSQQLKGNSLEKSVLSKLFSEWF
jgi:hypothetical protein